VSALASQFRRTAAGLGFDEGPWTFVLSLGYVALVLWFSYPTLLSLHLRWVDFGYSHGYLVLLLVAWLAVRASRESAGPSAPSIGGLGVLALCLLGTLVAFASSVTLVAQLLLPPLWVAAISAVAGWRSASRFVLPFGYLYFAVPIWDLLNAPLQSLTVVAVSAWIGWADIPALIEGNRIHIPSGTFEVAGGCSGLHYFVVGLALAALCGLLHHERWKPRLALVLLAAALSLLANWVRVFSVILAGHLTEMQHFLIVKDHYYFGWALFFVFFVPVFLLDRRLQSSAGPVSFDTGPVVPRSSAGVRALRAAGSVAVALGIWAQHQITAGPAHEESAVEVVLPQVSGWAQQEEWSGDTRPTFLGVTAEAARWYADGAARVGVYVGHYARQQQGREAIFHANRPEGASGEIVSRQQVAAVGSGGVELPFAALEVVDARGERRLVLSGLRVAGSHAASNARAKALQSWGVVVGRRDAQVLVLTTACAPDCEAAGDLLLGYAAAAAEAVYAAAERSSAN
jgi:EpsI family protein